MEALLERLLEHHPATVRDWAKEIHENSWGEEEDSWKREENPALSAFRAS